MSAEVICLSSDDEDSERKYNSNVKTESKSPVSSLSSVSSPSSTSNSSSKFKRKISMTSTNPKRVQLTTISTGKPPEKKRKVVEDGVAIISAGLPGPSTSGYKLIDGKLVNMNGNMSDVFEEDDEKDQSNEDRNSTKTANNLSPKVEIKKPSLVIKERHPVKVSNNQDVFSMFIGQCLQRERDQDMQKIVSKLKRRYEELDKDYAESEAFAELLNEKRDVLLSGGSIYKHIREVMQEMKLRKAVKSSYSSSNLRTEPHYSNNDQEKTEQNAESRDAEDDEQEPELEPLRDRGREKKIRKLEKTMEIVQKRINKYEEAEVDWDDDDDSAYLKLERYKQRMVELYQYWCKLKNSDNCAERSYLMPKYFESLTGIITVDQAINSFVNSKIARRRNNPDKKSSVDCIVFPDYVDILNLVHTHNVNNRLGMSSSDETGAAKRAFSKLGEYLKRARQKDLFDSFFKYYESGQKDPADDASNSELRNKLSSNQVEGDKKMNEVFEEYTKKQDELKARGSTSDGKLKEKNNVEDDDDDDDDEEEDDDMSNINEDKIDDIDDIDKIDKLINHNVTDCDDSDDNEEDDDKTVDENNSGNDDGSKDDDDTDDSDNDNDTTEKNVKDMKAVYLVDDTINNKGSENNFNNVNDDDLSTRTGSLSNVTLAKVIAPSTYNKLPTTVNKFPASSIMIPSTSTSPASILVKVPIPQNNSSSSSSSSKKSIKVVINSNNLSKTFASLASNITKESVKASMNSSNIWSRMATPSPEPVGPPTASLKSSPESNKYDDLPSKLYARDTKPLIPAISLPGAYDKSMPKSEKLKRFKAMNLLSECDKSPATNISPKIVKLESTSVKSPSTTNKSPSPMVILPSHSSKPFSNASKSSTPVRLPPDTNKLPQSVLISPQNSSKSTSNSSKPTISVKLLPSTSKSAPSVVKLSMNSSKSTTEFSKPSISVKLPSDLNKLPSTSTKLPTDAGKSPSPVVILPMNSTKPTSELNKSSISVKSPSQQNKSPSTSVRLAVNSSQSPSTSSKLPANYIKLPSRMSKSPTSVQSPSASTKSPSDLLKLSPNSSKWPSNLVKLPSSYKRVGPVSSKFTSTSIKLPSESNKSTSSSDQSSRIEITEETIVDDIDIRDEPKSYSIKQSNLQEKIEDNDKSPINNDDKNDQVNEIDAEHVNNNENKKDVAVAEQPILKLRSFAKPPEFWQSSQESSIVEDINVNNIDDDDSLNDSVEILDDDTAVNKLIKINNNHRSTSKPTVLLQIIKKNGGVENISQRLVLTDPTLIRKIQSAKNIQINQQVIPSSKNLCVLDGTKDVCILPFKKNNNLRIGNVEVAKPSSSLNVNNRKSISNENDVQSSIVTTSLQRVLNPVAKYNNQGSIKKVLLVKDKNIKL